MASPHLDDKALSIFAFAAYHSLVGGEAVTKIVLDDGQGHHADPEGVEALERAGLLHAEGERGRFTPEGSALLGRLIEALRAAR